MCQALLDLCRLPVPNVRHIAGVLVVCLSPLTCVGVGVTQSAEWTVVRGSALAALCNAALATPTVLSALQSCQAADVVLDVIEGKSVKSGLKFAKPTAAAAVAASGGDVTDTVEPEVACRAAALLARLSQDADVCATLKAVSTACCVTCCVLPVDGCSCYCVIAERSLSATVGAHNTLSWQQVK